ncbi:MAG: AbrB/MazE/SpoVT family DNA-binding domain-containing protein [Dehalococcoidales bacterium]|nr:AbrB/MazE/SpoVT family DNA-binding domain-containing protein [Dehalococcoidales bacterium]
MTINDKMPRFKVFGSMVVSPRGQVVIPANARKELGIGSGDTLLACGTPNGEGLLLLKVDTVEQMLSVMSEQLAIVGKLVQDYRSGKSGKPETEE